MVQTIPTSVGFSGTAPSYLFLPSGDNLQLQFDTDEFTIEWQQYQTDSNPTPYVFSVGSLGYNTKLAVSFDASGQYYFWVNNTPRSIRSVFLGNQNNNNLNIKNKWVYFSISRNFFNNYPNGGGGYYMYWFYITPTKKKNETNILISIRA
jgi:hypothetical protein